jgi:hypothetical protein
VQADGRTECASCGVVFSRLRDAQDRAFARRITQSQRQPVPVPEPSSGVTVSPWVIIVGVVLLAVIGASWTARRRADRERRDLAAEGNAMLDELNAKHNEQRRRLAEKATKDQPKWESSLVGVQSKTGAPPGLDAERAKTLLQQCSGFLSTQLVEIPKIIPDSSRGYALQQSPPLYAAENAGAVSLDHDGSNYKVTQLPTVTGRLQVSETERFYVINAGRRRVTSVTGLRGTETTATGSFAFEFDDTYAASLLLRENYYFEGVAKFERTAGAWRAVSALPPTKRATVTPSDLCP